MGDTLERKVGNSNALDSMANKLSGLLDKISGTTTSEVIVKGADKAEKDLQKVAKAAESTRGAIDGIEPISSQDFLNSKALNQQVRRWEKRMEELRSKVTWDNGVLIPGNRFTEGQARDFLVAYKGYEKYAQETGQNIREEWTNIFDNMNILAPEKLFKGAGNIDNYVQNVVSGVVESYYSTLRDEAQRVFAEDSQPKVETGPQVTPETQAYIDSMKEARQQQQDLQSEATSIAQGISSEFGLTATSVRFLTQEIKQLMEALKNGEEIDTNGILEIIQSDTNIKGKADENNWSKKELARVRNYLKNANIRDEPEFASAFPDWNQTKKSLAFNAVTKKGTAKIEEVIPEMNEILGTQIDTYGRPEQLMFNLVEYIQGLQENAERTVGEFIQQYIEGFDTDGIINQIQNAAKKVYKEMPETQARKPAPTFTTDEDGFMDLSGFTQDEDDPFSEMFDSGSQAAGQFGQVSSGVLKQFNEQLQEAESKTKTLQDTLLNLDNNFLTDPTMLFDGEKDETTEQDFIDQIESYKKLLQETKELKENIDSMNVSGSKTLQPRKEHDLEQLNAIEEKANEQLEEAEKRLIIKRQSEIKNRIESNKDFAEYGDIAWIDEYVEQVKDKTISLDKVYSDFLQRLIDNKTRIIEEQQRTQEGQNRADIFTNFLREMAGDDDALYDDYLDRFSDRINRLKQLESEVTTEMSEVNSILLQERQTSSGTGEGGGSGLGDAMDSDADEIGEGAGRVQQAAERAKLAYKTVEEIIQEAESKRGTRRINDEYDMASYLYNQLPYGEDFNLDDYEHIEDQLERHNEMLKDLINRRDEMLSNADDYYSTYVYRNNDTSGSFGEDKINEAKEEYEKYLDYYNRYAEAISYVQERISTLQSEKIQGWESTGTWDAENINHLVETLKILAQEISAVSNAFKDIDGSGSQFGNLVNNVQSLAHAIDEAFKTDNIEAFNQSIQNVASTLETISSSIGVFGQGTNRHARANKKSLMQLALETKDKTGQTALNLHVRGDDNKDQAWNAKLSDIIKQYETGYNKLLSVAGKNIGYFGTKTEKLMYSLVGTNTPELLQEFGTPGHFQELYGLSEIKSIQNPEEQIRRFVDFFKWVRQSLQETYQGYTDTIFNELTREQLENLNVLSTNEWARYDSAKDERDYNVEQQLMDLARKRFSEQQAKNKVLMDDPFWSEVQKLTLPSGDMKTIERNRREIFDIQDGRSNAKKSALDTIKELVEKSVLEEAAPTGGETVSSANLPDFSEYTAQLERLTSAIRTFKKTLADGLGIAKNDQGETTSYLESIKTMLDNLSNSSGNLAKAISDAMKSVTAGENGEVSDLGKKIQDGINSQKYTVDVQLKDQNGLSGQIQNAIDSGGPYKIEVEANEINIKKEKLGLNKTEDDDWGVWDNSEEQHNETETNDSDRQNRRLAGITSVGQASLDVIPAQYIKGYIRSIDDIKEQLSSDGVPQQDLDAKAQEIRNAEIEAISELSDGFVRVIHRTRAENLDSITKNGLGLNGNYIQGTTTFVNGTLNDDQGTHNGMGSFIVADVPIDYYRAFEERGIPEENLGVLKEQYDLESQILSISSRIEQIYEDNSAIEERNQLFERLIQLGERYNQVVGNGGGDSLSLLLHGDSHGGNSYQQNYNSIEKIQSLLKNNKPTTSTATQELNDFQQKSKEVFEEFGKTQFDIPVEFQEFLNAITNDGATANDMLQKLRETLQSLSSAAPDKPDLGLEETGASAPSAIEGIQGEGTAAEETKKKKDDLSASNEKLAQTMKETGEAGEEAAEGIKSEAYRAKQAQDDADEDTSDHWAKRIYTQDGQGNPVAKTEISKEKRDDKYITTAYRSEFDSEKEDYTVTGIKITNDYETAAKEAAKAAEQEAKALDNTNKFIIQQTELLSRLNEKYVENAKVTISEKDKADLTSQKETLEEMIAGVDNKTTESQKELIRQRMKQFQQSAQLAVARQQVSTDMQAYGPEAAKERQTTRIKQLLRDMKLSSAETSDLEKELEELLSTFQTSGKDDKPYFAEIRNKYNAIKERFADKDDEYKTNYSIMDKEETALAKYEKAVQGVVKARTALDFADNKSDPLLVQNLQDAIDKAKEARDELEGLGKLMFRNKDFWRLTPQDWKDDFKNRYYAARDTEKDPTQAPLYQSKQMQVDSQENRKQANEQLEIIQKLIDARSRYNKILAEDIVGKSTATDDERSALNDEIESLKAQAEAAVQIIENLRSAGKIQFDEEGLKAYNDMLKAMNIGSEESVNALDAAGILVDISKIQEAQKAIDDYYKSAQKVQELQSKMDSGEGGKGLAKQLMNQIKVMNEAKDAADKGMKTLENFYNNGYASVIDARGYDATKNRYNTASTTRDSITGNLDSLGFENANRAYQTLIVNAERYAQVLEKQRNNEALSFNELSFLQRIGQYYQDASNSAGIFADATDEASQKLKQLLEEALNNADANVIKQTYGSLIETISELGNKTWTEKGNQQLEELKTQLEAIAPLIVDIQNATPAQRMNIRSSLDKIGGAEGIGGFLGNAKNQYLAASDRDISVVNRQMSEWISKNSAAVDFIPQVKELQNSLNGISVGGLNDVKAAFEDIKREAIEAGQVGRTFGDALKNSFGGLARYLMTYASFYRVIGILKQGVSVVKELDTALTEMRKVSDESTSTLKDFQKESFNMADSVGTTAKQIQMSTADWMRLGESLEDAKESAEVSTVLLNVSEFSNIDEATQALTSASQAYQEFEKIDIVDKLNNIGNNFSVSTDQLAQGLQNAAAVLKTQGNDLDQALALLTAGNAITQDISKTSAGIRTISLRISGTEEAKNEIQDMGEDIDDFVVRTKSKTDQIIRDYTAVASNDYKGVSVLDPNGNLRDTYDIMLDIAEIYKEIQEEDKKRGTNRAQALVEQLAGKNRSNIAASILNNPKMLKDVYEASRSSQGSAQAELDKYLDSIQGKMDRLTNKLQEFASITINSDGLKVMLDIANSLLSVVNSLTESFGGLNTVIGIIAGGFLQKTGAGILRYDKTKNGIGLGGLGQKLFLSRGAKKQQALNNVEISDAVSALFSGQGNGGFNLDENFQKQTDELWGGSIIGMVSAMGDKQFTKFIENMDQAKLATMSAGEVLNEFKVSLLNTGTAFSTLGSIGLTALSTLGNMAISMIASFAIEEGIKAIYRIVKAEEIAIKTGKEAKNAADETFKTYQSSTDALKTMGKELSGSEKDLTSNADAIDKVAEKYTELHSGVNAFTNENISLTDEEYQQYLNTCNQLAEQFPSLVKGYDDQSNAILSLGDSADAAKTKLTELYAAQQLSANVEIAKNMQAIYDGVIATENKLNRDNNRLSATNQNLESLTHGATFDSDTVISVNGQDEENVRNIMRQMYDMIPAETWIDEQTGNVKMYFSHLSDLTESEMQDLKNALNNAGEMAEDSTVAMNKHQIKANEMMIEDQWASMTDVIGKYLSTSTHFTELDSGIQSAILGNLENLDLSRIKEYGGEVMPFLYAEFLEPLDGLSEDVQEKLSKAFVIDPKKLSGADYQNQIREILNAAFPNDQEAVNEWYNKLGFNKIGEKYVEDQQATLERLKNNSNIQITSDDYQKLFGLNADELETARKIATDKAFGTIEEFWKAFDKERQKKASEIKPEGTLSDIFNNEDYKTNAENYEKNLSSLTSALETLRTEGKLTAEQMRDLQEEFPSLTDFSAEGIGKKGQEELNAWIKELRSGYDELNEDGKQQIDTYTQNLVTSYGDLSRTLEDVRGDYVKSYIDKNGDFIGRSEIAGKEFDAQVDELQNRLEAEGKELDVNVVYLMTAKDEFSGKADEIYSKYNGYKFVWDIEVANENKIKDIQQDIEGRNSRIASQEGRNSLKEKTTSLSPTDYAQIIRDQTQNRDDNQTIANMRRTAFNLSNTLFKSFVSDDQRKVLEQQMYEADQQLTQSESDLLDTLMEQRESAANKFVDSLDSQTSQTENLNTQIDNAKSNGERVSKEMYSSLEESYKNESTINDRLAQFYQAMANNTEGKWKTTFQDKANEYAQAAQSAMDNALEASNGWMNDQLTIDSNTLSTLDNQLEKVQNRMDDIKGGDAQASDYIEQMIINAYKSQNLQSQIDTKMQDTRAELPHTDEDYIAYQSELKELEDELHNVTQAQNEFVQSMLQLPIDNVTDGIEKYEDKLKHLQEDQQLKETKGQFLTTQDYDQLLDEQQDIIQKRQALNGVLGVADMGARLLGFDQNSELRKSIASTKSSNQSELSSMLGSFFETKKSRNEQPIKEAQRELEALQRAGEQFQSTFDAISREGRDATAADYNMLMQNAQAQIDKYDFIKQSYEGLRDDALEDGRKADYITYDTEALSAASAIENLKQQQYDYNEAIKQIPIQEFINKVGGYTDLQRDATEIETELNNADAKHVKTSAQLYDKLIKNGDKQVSNLEDQRKEWQKLQTEVTRGSSKWQEYQGEIDNINSSIDSMRMNQLGWAETMQSLVSTNAQTLSSTLSSAFSEMNSETGLSIDTMNELERQFSDLAGRDVSDIFYRSADGMKMNTAAAEALVDAEYELQTNQLYDAIAKENEIIKAQGDAQDENARRTIADAESRIAVHQRELAMLQALYDQQKEQFSGLAKFQNAQSTANAGADFETMQGYLKTQQENRTKGLTGTDEFRAYAEYFDRWGLDTVAAWDRNKEKVQRYLTEDFTGMRHFFDDLVTNGLAEKDSDAYNLDIENVKDAAEQMGMTVEWFMDMLGRAEDYGFRNDWIESELDGREKIQEAIHQQIEAQKELTKAQQEGAPEEVIEDARNVYEDRTAHLNNLRDEVKTINARPTGLTKDEFLTNVAMFKAIRNDWKHAQTDEEREAYEQELTRLAEETGLKVDLKFKIDKDSYNETLEEYGVMTKDQIPKASDLGIGIERAPEYEQLSQSLYDLNQNADSDIQAAINTLGNYTAEQLRSLDLISGGYDDTFEGSIEAEKAMDALNQALGNTGENADLLAYALEALGLTQQEVTEETTTEVRKPKKIEPKEKISLPSVDTLTGLVPDNVKQGFKEKGQEFLEGVKTWAQDTTAKAEEQAAAQREVDQKPTVDSINNMAESVGQAIESGLDNLGTTFESVGQSIVNAIEVITNPDGQNGKTTETPQVETQKPGISTAQAQQNKLAKDENRSLSSGDVSTTVTATVVPGDTSQLQGIDATADATVEDVNVPDGVKVEVEGTANITEAENNIVKPMSVDVTTNANIEVPDGGMKQSVSVDTNEVSEASGAVSELSSQVSNIPKGTAHVDAETSSAMSALQSVEDKLYEVGNTPSNPIVNITVNGKTELDSAKNTIANLKDKTITITTKHVSTGSSGGGGGLGGINNEGFAFAGGTEKDRVIPTTHAGETLVGEEGYEIHVDRDGRQWNIVGENGPEFRTDIAPDDIVFNHEQSKKLLKNGYTTSRGKALASGNVEWHGPAYVDKGNGKNDNPAVKGSFSPTMPYVASETLTKTVGDSTGAIKDQTKTTDDNTKAVKDSTSKLDKFQQWLDSLKDWIEVRLSRLTYKMEMAITKSENLGGKGDKTEKLKGDKKKVARTSTYSDKNDYVDEAIRYNNALQRDNERGAKRYKTQANTIVKRAKKAKLITGKQAKQLVPRIQEGAISIQDFSKYINKKKNKNGSDSTKTENTVKTFIDAYTEWYEKMLDCKKAQEECIAKAKELQQTKLDNITEQFETLADYASSVVSTSDSFMKIMTARGQAAVNDHRFKEQYDEQMRQQNYTTGYLKAELKAYDAEMKNAIKIYGKDSNEYHEAMIKRNEIEAKMNESIATYYELRKQQFELEVKNTSNIIERIKGIASLFKGRISLLEKIDNENATGGHGSTDPNRFIELNTGLMDRNNQLIQYWDEQRKKAAEWIGKNQMKQSGEDQSDEYQEQYMNYIEAEQEILSLMEEQEDIKKAIHDYRWKSFKDLQETIQTTIDEMDKLRSTFRDAQFFDSKYGINITDEGYANILLLSQGIAESKQQIADYRKAMEKLNEDYENGNITLTEYKETYKEYQGVIDSASERVRGNQDELIKMYTSQLQAENDLLQKNLQARSAALQAKKNYYDYDKTLKGQNKDIASLTAQINSLQGASDAASQARLAKLQQQLKDAREEQDDTIYNHSIEVQQSGYDKIAEDATEALNDTLRELDADQAIRDEAVRYQINLLDQNEAAAQKAIDNQVKTQGVFISEKTDDFIKDYDKNRVVQSAVETKTSEDVDSILTSKIPTLNATTKQIGEDITNEISSKLGDTTTGLPGINSAMMKFKTDYDANQKNMKQNITNAINAAKFNEVLEKKIGSNGTVDNTGTEEPKKTNTGKTGGGNTDGGTNQNKDTDTAVKQLYAELEKLENSIQATQKNLAQAASSGQTTAANSYTKTLDALYAQRDNIQGQISRLTGATPVTTPKTSSTGNLGGAILMNEKNSKEDANKKAAVKKIVESTGTKLSSAEKKSYLATKGLSDAEKLIANKFGYKPGKYTLAQIALALGMTTSSSGKTKLTNKTQITSAANKKYIYDLMKAVGYRSGSHSTDDELNWLHDNEVIIRKSDGAILQPFNSGDMVFTSTQSENLWKLSKLSTDAIKQMVANPDMSKFITPRPVNVSPANNTNQSLHIDSLITINGNADQQTVADIREIAEQLVKDRDFNKNVTNMLTKNMTREAAKIGYRR